MKDQNETVVGIRLRSPSGGKWAVTGSHQGCFIPDGNPESMVLVCEGPTDTAAALDLGFYAVGRPSCSGGGPQLKEFVLRHHIMRVVICADNDEPGIKGAKALVEILPVPCAVLTFPCKDLRQYLKNGGTAETLHRMIFQSIWENE